VSGSDDLRLMASPVSMLARMLGRKQGKQIRSRSGTFVSVRVVGEPVADVINAKRAENYRSLL